jgi:hypothetical protein
MRKDRTEEDDQDITLEEEEEEDEVQNQDLEEDQWAGDSKDWVDAKTFVKRVRNQYPQ